MYTPTRNFTPAIYPDEVSMIIDKMPARLMAFVPAFAREAVREIRRDCDNARNADYLLMCALFQAGRIQGIRDERLRRSRKNG